MRTPPTHGDLAMYDKRKCRCSLCRDAKAAAQRAYTERRRQAGTATRYDRSKSATCGHCASPFMGRSDKPARFCSPACARDAQGRRDTPRFRITPAKRSAIYERDNGKCMICLEPTDANAHPQSDWYPTLDHVTPQSQGGTDDPDNLRTAHRWCNSVRGDLRWYTDADLQPQG
jgi:5-methylcytosine-specific restriction endonuclease McrA